MNVLQTTEVEAGPTSKGVTVVLPLLLLLMMMKMAIGKLMLILKISPKGVILIKHLSSCLFVIFSRRI